MSIYECSETGVINIKPSHSLAQFSVVKNYNILYHQELPRFKKNPLKIYGLPFHKTPKKVYLGLDRMGLEPLAKKAKLSKEDKIIAQQLESFEIEADSLMFSEQDAKKYRSLFREADDYELIWSRIVGSDESIPKGYSFIGYDVTCPPSYNGAFSIICDCMFICKWHCCDREGTLFSDDFKKLNQNGLFNDAETAYDYMKKYLNADWTERGEFGIFEIYI